MSYVWVYLHRSYIVMDPPTCGVCLGSFASQKFVLSRDIICASKNPSTQFHAMTVHHIYLWIE